MLWEADRRSVVLGTALQVVAGAGFGLQLLIANRIASVLLGADGGHGRTTTIVGLIGLAGVVIAAVTFAATSLAGVQKLLGERVVRHVQRLIMDSAVATDVLQFEEPAFYDRLQRAQLQGVPTPLMISGAILQGSAALAVALGVGIALLFINPILLPLVFLGAIPAGIAAARSSQDQYGFSYGNTANDRSRAALSSILTTRGNVEEARLFGIGPVVRRRWEDLYEIRISDAVTLVTGLRRRAALASVVYAGGAAAVFATLAVLVLQGHTSIAAAATAAIAAQQLGSQLLTLVGAAAIVYENVLYLDDFDAFANIGRHAVTTSRQRAPEVIERIGLHDVHLRYPGSDALAIAGVTLDIPAGQILALVGENGSGKTTLAKLLCGLYPPTSGKVTWNGIDLATLDTESVHAKLAAVFQDFVRYPFTLADNVSIGDADRIADRAVIEQAIGDAGATDLAANLPNGPDTMLGKQFEGGTDLSVGQWQRIALARAFYRSAPILILDEPTSALDPRAEQNLFDSIRRLCAGRTVIIISHRFSSVRSADHIVVLDHGRIREQGTHDELIRHAGHYAELFNLQASAYLGANDLEAATPDASCDG